MTVDEGTESRSLTQLCQGSPRWGLNAEPALPVLTSRLSYLHFYQGAQMEGEREKKTFLRDLDRNTNQKIILQDFNLYFISKMQASVFLKANQVLYPCECVCGLSNIMCMCDVFPMCACVCVSMCIHSYVCFGICVYMWMCVHSVFVCCVYLCGCHVYIVLRHLVSVQ